MKVHLLVRRGRSNGRSRDPTICKIKTSVLFDKFRAYLFIIFVLTSGSDVIKRSLEAAASGAFVSSTAAGQQGEFGPLLIG